MRRKERQADYERLQKAELDRQSEISNEERLQKRRRQRIELMSAEVDVLRAAAVERTRALDTKSAFVVVAAGVIASVTFSDLIDVRSFFIGFGAQALIIASIFIAAMALFPKGLSSPSARLAVDKWITNGRAKDYDLASMEFELLWMKVREIEKRNKWNEENAKLTRWAFWLLFSGILIATIAHGLNTVRYQGELNHGETNPIHTAEPTGAS